MVQPGARATQVEYHYDALDRQIGRYETVYDSPGGLIVSSTQVFNAFDPTGRVMEIQIGDGETKIYRHYFNGPVGTGVPAVDQADRAGPNGDPAGPTSTVWLFPDMANTAATVGWFNEGANQ